MQSFSIVNIVSAVFADSRLVARDIFSWATFSFLVDFTVLGIPPGTSCEEFSFRVDGFAFPKSPSAVCRGMDFDVMTISAEFTS